jgi:nucleoside-diphosphate-sugar epimerase
MLITGGSGFIGKNYCLHNQTDEILATYNNDGLFPEFVRKNNLRNVNPIKCDLTDKEDVKKLYGHVDVCLYLAANSDPSLSVKDPEKDRQMNVDAIKNFTEQCKADKFIFFSSGAVYDGLQGKVSPESKIDPKLPYAISKLAAEQHIKKNVDNYTIIRFFGAYGPYEPERKIYTKLIKALYLNGEKEFTIRGDGKNLIDAMYIDDAIGGISKIIESKKTNITVDFCVGAPLTIEGLVDEVCKIFDKRDVKLNKTGRSVEPIEFRPSPEGFNDLFDFKAHTPLEQGMRYLAKHLEQDAKHNRASS